MSQKINRREFIKTGTLVGLGVIMGCSLRHRFDLIIKNGAILDGSSAESQPLDIGIRGDKIITLGNLSRSTADRTIEAKGLIVSPGFIDIHTHTDSELLVNPKAESKIRQGITTEISGNCGYSPFPMTPGDQAEYAERLSEKYGLEVTWHRIDGFFRAIEQRRTAMNYMTFTGHGSLRSFVIGKNDVQPTQAQLREMQTILAATMESGSLGLSTGLEYAPGSYAQTPEIIELCKTVAHKKGVYATHIRNEDDHVEEAIGEALEISRKSGVSLQISHLKACNRANWHKVDHLLEMIHSAHQKGLPVHADRYPYKAWSTGLSSFLPLWARQGDTDAILARLKQNSTFRDIAIYAQQRAMRIGGWEKVVIADCYEEQNAHWEGKSIRQCAREAHQKPLDFVRDLLLSDRNRVSVIGFAMDENNLKKVLASPLVMIGSDGSAVAPYGLLGEGKPHPRYYGTFPRVLGKYARHEQLMKLGTAIRKMTSMPALKLNLVQRGLIKKGYYADITIFDADRVIDKATFTDPHQYPEGIKYVIVNGELVIDQERHTGVLPGRILRHKG